MRGSLKVRREEGMRYDCLADLFSARLEGEKVHLLITDGIVLDYPGLISEDAMDKMYVQRILTPYQLEKILMGSDNNPHILLLKSEVLESWSRASLESIHDILMIKTSYYGCKIDLIMVGKPGVYQYYLGGKLNNPVDVSVVEDLSQWEEVPLP